MSSLKKYELLYQQQQQDVCGEPFSEFAQFAKGYTNRPTQVLDLGFGQGRDAFVFAQEGMQVTGVDISATGIKQMLDACEQLGLSVQGVVCNILDYSPDVLFDIIVLDRTLHMLSSLNDRLLMLQRCASWLKDDGHILIADEPANISAFKAWFQEDNDDWLEQQGMKKGFCFLQKCPSS